MGDGFGCYWKINTDELRSTVDLVFNLCRCGLLTNRAIRIGKVRNFARLWAETKDGTVRNSEQAR